MKKFKEILVGILACVGVVSICLTIGFVIGMNKKIPALSVESNQSNDSLSQEETGNTETSQEETGKESVEINPTQTPQEEIGSSETVVSYDPEESTENQVFTEFNITEEDFIMTDNDIEFSYELVEYIKTFPLYSNYDNETIVAIIQSPTFKTVWKIGVMFGDIQGKLEEELSDKGTHALFKKSVAEVALAEKLVGADDPAGNTGGSIVDVGDRDADDLDDNGELEDNKEFNESTDAEEEADQEETPKQEEQQQEKPTPKPTETPKQEEQQQQETQTITVLKPINPEDPSEGFYEDTITSAGTFIAKKGNYYFIPDGLEDYHEPIYIETKYEKMAWTTKYPGADSGTITITQNGEDIKYYFVIPGGKVYGPNIKDDSWIDIDWRD